MTGLTLPALDGRTPLGFLAALGVLRLVTEHGGHQARLAWSRQDCTAILHDAQPDLDALSADLVAVTDSIPADGVLPGLPADFPPLRGAPARMRFTRHDLRDFIEDALGRGGEAAERWLASLVTDLAVDAGGNGAISLFAAPSGQQSMRSMLYYPLQSVRARPEVLREALTAWRRYPDVSGEYLDHRVLFDAVDAADGKPAERGVPGATWLALMSYPLMLTTAQGSQPATTSWQDQGRREGKRMVYPLWSEPLDVHAVRAVLSHDILKDAAPGLPPASARALSIFWIAHARRRKIPGRTFAGVLTPTSTPAGRGASRASSRGQR